MSSHYAAYLKLTQVLYVSFISTELKKRKHYSWSLLITLQDTAANDPQEPEEGNRLSNRVSPKWEGEPEGWTDLSQGHYKNSW